MIDDQFSDMSKRELRDFLDQVEGRHTPTMTREQLQLACRRAMLDVFLRGRAQDIANAVAVLRGTGSAYSYQEAVNIVERVTVDAFKVARALSYAKRFVPAELLPD